MVAKWEAELMMFYRTVVQTLDSSLLSSIDALTFWIDSNSLAQFPKLHHLWNIMCCLGFDDSQSFEEDFKSHICVLPEDDSQSFEEDFKSHICVLPEDFQLDVEVIRLYRHSWRDRPTDNQGVWTIPAEVKTRLNQVSDISQARKRDFGSHYLELCRAKKKISLVRHQLRVVSSLLERDVAEWSQLSAVKLKASQLSLGLNPEELPKTILLLKTDLNICFLLSRVRSCLFQDHPLLIDLLST